MNIHRITYNPKQNSTSLYFIGCNFHCLACSWKQIYGKVNFKNLMFLGLNEVIKILKPVSPRKVYILSGDPKSNPEFDQLPRALHSNFNCEVRLLTNGYSLPDLEGLAHVSISIKAVSDGLHKRYTGKSNQRSLENFRSIYKKGIGLSASSVYIPDLIDKDEIERIAKFIFSIDENIPYRIIGYMKVDGLSFRDPTYEEVKKVADVVTKYIKNVTFSRPIGEDYTGIVDLFTNNLRRM